APGGDRARRRAGRAALRPSSAPPVGPAGHARVALAARRPHLRPPRLGLLPARRGAAGRHLRPPARRRPRRHPAPRPGPRGQAYLTDGAVTGIAPTGPYPDRIDLRRLTTDDRRLLDEAVTVFAGALGPGYVTAADLRALAGAGADRPEAAVLVAVAEG